jgi:hypothetical protein
MNAISKINITSNSTSLVSQLKKPLSPDKISLIMQTFQQLLKENFADTLLQKLKEAQLEIPTTLINTFLQKDTSLDSEPYTLEREYIDEILNYIHNAKCRKTQLADKNPEKDLRIHHLGDAYQPRATQGIRQYLPNKMITSLLRMLMKVKYNPQILSMSPAEEQLLQEKILEIEQRKDTLLLLNHDHLGNFLIATLKLMLVAHQLGKKEINNDIYMLVGTLVKTNRVQNTMMNGFAHIIITQPATNTSPNDKEELKEVHNFQRAKAKEKLFSLLSLDKEGYPLPEKPTTRGKIILVNPYGTREIIAGTANAPFLYLPDESHVSNRTSFGLINKIKKS